MSFKAIPSRRSNRNIGSTTDAEVKYKPGRCVRHGLHTSLVHGAPVARKVLTLGGGGVGRRRRRVGVLAMRASDVRCPKDETRRTGNPRPPAAHMLPPLVTGGGSSHPGLFSLQAAIHPGEPGVVDDAARCAARRYILSVPLSFGTSPRAIHPQARTHARPRGRRDGYAAVHAPRVTLQHERTMR